MPDLLWPLVVVALISAAYGFGYSQGKDVGHLEGMRESDDYYDKVLEDIHS